jgi:hypothetical protein
VYAATYVLPIRTTTEVPAELIDYLERLSDICEVIVVDGSAPHVFGDFAARRRGRVQHVALDSRHQDLLNGKVAGVLTGLQLASHDRIVIADDDVRYDSATLGAVLRLLDIADVVRPQNVFAPMPWHARLDTARTLINRVVGGDWPGTLALRRAVMQRTNGYDGNVLFENLELIRTVRAAGGRELVARDVFVTRLPPSTRHFLSQRIRQAYDEFARPVRLAVWLSVVPLVIAAWAVAGIGGIAGLIALSIAWAEAGRRVAGGRRAFPATAAFWAPLWLVERGVSAWLALGSRIVLGGVRYRGRVVRAAATPMRNLRRRYAG